MMKKLIFTLLSCSLLLTACGTSDDTTPALSETETATVIDDETEPLAEVPETTESTETPESTEHDSADLNSILGYPVHFADVTNGFGTDTIGERAYVEISKNELKNMSEEEYSELCTYVESLDKNWFTVVCDDGTGLVFTGCSSIIVTYGQLDDSGRIDVSLGDILNSGGSITYTESQTDAEEIQPDSETAAETPDESALQPDPVDEPASDTTASGDATADTSAQSADATPAVPQSDSGDGNGDNFNTYDNPEQQETTATYVLNTNTMKIHHPSCSSVAKIAPHNYATSSQSIDELKAQGYDTCKRCF
ncbi:MAG: hypothetical protein HDR17_12245 [Lachnospiraceae bacterium]|nr:hypothetical protein [Lachnospiraceae bacterium]